MSARCNRAPFPLYTGKPAPVIFTPSSKSMMSYFLTNSQWGCAPSCKAGISPDWNTVRFSSGVLPSGTMSAGVFGSAYNFWVSSCANASPFSESCLLCSLNCAVFSLRISALAFSPDFMSSPISRDSLLDSDKILSSATCVARRASSIFTISATASVASMFLLAKA